MIKKTALTAVVIAAFFSQASNAGEPSKKLSMLSKAIAGDYISQRNLAYSYMNGRGSIDDKDYIPQDIISGCAWRKLIMLTNKSADIGDAGNESIDCNKVHPADNGKVWEKVHAGIQIMAQLDDVNNKKR